MRTVGLWLATVLVGLSLLGVCEASQEAHDGSLGQSQDSGSGVPAYVGGELRVTFTEEAAQTIEQTQRTDRPPLFGISSLDRLRVTYAVVAIDRVFPEIPELAQLYRVRLRLGANIMEAASAFADDAHVEHVQPNYLGLASPYGELFFP